VLDLSYDAAGELLAACRRREARATLELAQTVTALAMGDRDTARAAQKPLIADTTRGLGRAERKRDDHG
jgi:hypothetical protein